MFTHVKLVDWIVLINCHPGSLVLHTIGQNDDKNNVLTVILVLKVYSTDLALHSNNILGLTVDSLKKKMMQQNHKYCLSCQNLSPNYPRCNSNTDR